MDATSPAPLLQLTYEPAHDLLIGRWGYQPDPAELPTAYEHLQEMALTCQAAHWLQDIRRRTLHDPYTTQWLFDEFFPDMAQFLGRQLRIAYVVQPELRGLIEAGVDTQPLSSYLGRPFVVNFFGEEQAALDWLDAA